MAQRCNVYFTFVTKIDFFSYPKKGNFAVIIVFKGIHGLFLLRKWGKSANNYHSILWL
jgi:hypothetical protein